MASAAALSSSAHQLFNDNNHDGGREINRHEIQAAIAKAVELRALHAALIQGANSSPSSAVNLRYPPLPSSSSPASLPLFSAHDYPVFTPSYEEEPFPGNHSYPMKSITASESWDENETTVSDFKKETYSSSRKMAAVADDQKSVAGSYSAAANNSSITVLHTSPGGTELYKSSRTLNHHLADFKSSSSCNNRFRQTSDYESAGSRKTRVNSNIVVPLTDSHASVQAQPRSKGMMSWLFPRLRKKQPKNNNEPFSSPNRTAESDTVSLAFGESGLLSIETLRRELREANVTRDAALMEVSETRTSLESLRQKLEHLEGYCEDLKKSLKSAARTNRRGKSIDGNADGGENPSIFPVSDEAMVEGFLQMASESRLSVKQFCKTLIRQIDESDLSLIENLDTLLQPYKLNIESKNSKAILHHLESIINEAMHQDFENCVFQRNGSPKFLDPVQDRQAQFQSFVSLRNLSWNEVLRKGTKYYSEEFSKFCDQKMSCIITALNWTRPWPEQLLQAFFVAAKCIWLLHLLAFSFDPAIGIMRVEEGRGFDQRYMEDMERQRGERSGGDGGGGGGGRRRVVKVKAMVMPGFYVAGGRVLRCKVLCRYRDSKGYGYGSGSS